MKIYTKKGDTGETSLFGNVRVSKDSMRIHTYGTFDELNSILGLALAENPVPVEMAGPLLRIQGELFQLGAEMATPHGKTLQMALIDLPQIEALEKEIDRMESQLKPLSTFILPGGSRLSAILHLARTVSRRAERDLITLHRSEPARPEVLQYLNRLSDYLFVCARFANHLQGVADTPWNAPEKSTY